MQLENPIDLFSPCKAPGAYAGKPGKAQDVGGRGSMGVVTGDMMSRSRVRFACSCRIPDTLSFVGGGPLSINYKERYSFSHGHVD